MGAGLERVGRMVHHNTSATLLPWPHHAVIAVWLISDAAEIESSLYRLYRFSTPLLLRYFTLAANLWLRTTLYLSSVTPSQAYIKWAFRTHLERATACHTPRADGVSVPLGPIVGDCQVYQYQDYQSPFATTRPEPMRGVIIHAGLLALRVRYEL